MSSNLSKSSHSINSNEVRTAEWRKYPLDQAMLHRNRTPSLRDSFCHFETAWLSHELSGRVGNAEAVIRARLCMAPPESHDRHPPTPVVYVATQAQLFNEILREYISFSRRELATALKQLIAIGWVRPFPVGRQRYAFLTHGAFVYPPTSILGAGSIACWGIDAMATRSLRNIVLRPTIDEQSWYGSEGV